jgi:ABC-type multidrug transport system fused ATPase/permease subunit
VVNLETTNWILAVMAVGSVVQTVVIIGLAVVGWRFYTQATRTMNELETRHIVPLRQQVDTILVDVQKVASRVSSQTERVDNAITGTIDRVDETAERVRDSVREKVSRATGFVRGVRAVIMSILTSDSPTSAKPPAEAAGRL